MPCRDDYLPEPSSRRIQTKETIEAIAQKKFLDEQAAIKPYKERLDSITRLLCSILSKLEEHGEVKYDDLDNEIHKWHNEHKVADAKRIEDLKTNALSKLTDEEKKVLGILK